MISLPHKAPLGMALASLSRAIRHATDTVWNTDSPTVSPLEFAALAPDQEREQRYGLGRQGTISQERPQ